MPISAAQVSVWSHLGFQSPSVRQFVTLSETSFLDTNPPAAGTASFLKHGIPGKSPILGCIVSAVRQSG